jgi:exosortase family protein XrtF
MAAGALLTKWNKIPAAVKQFVLRGLIILIAWKILYLAFLLPTRLIDKPLSHSVGAGTAWLLNVYTHSHNYIDKTEHGSEPTDNGLTDMPLDNVYFHQHIAVSIEDTCNGLELFVLYAGFIICMPATLRRKIIFAVSGILLIYVVNIIRCTGVAYIILCYPQYADFAHHYVFTFVVYGVIIALWLIFSKKVKQAHGEA